MGTANTGPAAGTIQSVDRALRLLAIVGTSSEPLAGVEVATRAGINRSTAWKLLATLEEHRLIERDAANRYVVGTGVLHLVATAPWNAIVLVARPILEGLSVASGEAAVISVVSAGGITGVSQVDGPYALGVRWLGARFNLTTSSPGKLLLASLPEADLAAVLRTPIAARTSRTLTDPAAVRRELDDVRRRGLATSIGDDEVGVNGLSAPVADRAGRLMAAVSVGGPDGRLGVARLRDLEPVVVDAASRLTVALGLTS